MRSLEEIVYPYLPEGQRFYYVPLTNHRMLYARWWAQQHSSHTEMPGAAIVVLKGRILGAAANDPSRHSEAKAIKAALRKRWYITGADLYLWGDWWSCPSCWRKMTKAGIARVFLLERSHILFNKEHPENVIGRQFDL
ncbi:MAG: deaminase [Minisyncoccia bacterium]